MRNADESLMDTSLAPYLGRIRQAEKILEVVTKERGSEELYMQAWVEYGDALSQFGRAVIKEYER